HEISATEARPSQPRAHKDDAPQVGPIHVVAGEVSPAKIHRGTGSLRAAPEDLPRSRRRQPWIPVPSEHTRSTCGPLLNVSLDYHAGPCRHLGAREPRPVTKPISLVT